MASPFSMLKKSPYSDQDLLAGLLVNDRVITESLYQQCYPKVAAQLGRMGASQEDIRDMFQEGMVALWKNAKAGTYQLQADTKLSTYLVQVCKWQYADRLKKASTRRELGMETPKDVEEGSSFLDQWFKAEEMEGFYRVFHQLGERCQQLLKRFYFERESMQKIAGALSITAQSARNEKYRCMQRLKAKFKK